VEDSLKAENVAFQGAKIDRSADFLSFIGFILENESRNKVVYVFLICLADIIVMVAAFKYYVADKLQLRFLVVYDTELSAHIHGYLLIHLTVKTVELYIVHVKLLCAHTSS